MKTYYAAPGMKEVKLSKVITSTDIISLVCNTYQVNHSDLIKQNRQKELVFARHLAMYLVHTYTRLGVKQVGNLFKRDHTSVLHAKKMIQNYIDTNSFDKREEIQELINRCEYRLL